MKGFWVNENSKRNNIFAMMGEIRLLVPGDINAFVNYREELNIDDGHLKTDWNVTRRPITVPSNIQRCSKQHRYFYSYKNNSRLHYVHKGDYLLKYLNPTKYSNRGKWIEFLSIVLFLKSYHWVNFTINNVFYACPNHS